MRRKVVLKLEPATVEILIGTEDGSLYAPGALKMLLDQEAWKLKRFDFDTNTFTFARSPLATLDFSEDG